MNAKEQAWAKLVTALVNQGGFSAHKAGEMVDAYAAAAVVEARAPLVEALRAVEWGDQGIEGEDEPKCPFCGCPKEGGKHWRLCVIGVALAAKETP